MSATRIEFSVHTGASPRVQAFARQMINNDHSATSAVLQGFSGPFGMLDPRHAAMLSQLAASNGPSFERLYAQMQLSGHREAVALFTWLASLASRAALTSLTSRNGFPSCRAFI
jgi:predicted outer membrane protein